MNHRGSIIPSSDAPVTLLTLGGWALAVADVQAAPTPSLGPSKPLALLAYLACAPGRSATREYLVDLLWAVPGARATAAAKGSARAHALPLASA